MDAYFDVDQGRLPDLSLAGTLADGKGDGLNLGYYRRRPLSGLGEVDNLNVGVNIALLKPLYLGYSQRYDLLQSASLERILTLDLRQQCWGLKTTLRDREDDRSIMFEFTLSGIGSVGKFAQDFNPQ
jgi:LPS-assembly protein